jgi:hypothetical protein
MNEARGAGAEAPLETAVCVEPGADGSSHPQSSVARREASGAIKRNMGIASLPWMSLQGEKKAQQK